MCRRRSLPESAVRLAPVAIAALLASACADGASAPELPLRPAADNLGAPTLARIYRLGAGDKLQITVFGEPDLSGKFAVTAAGTVAMPLIGEIVAKGRPIADFRTALVSRLRNGVLKNPKVTVEVVSFRPIYVHGEVKNGGEFPYKSGLRLRDAVALAGGFTYRAQTSYLMITREGQSAEYKVRMQNDLTIMPGDNIRVPERFF